MLKAKIKTTAQRTKVQFIGLILFAHILPALCIPLYYLIIQANAGVWIIFLLLAVMVAITWGLGFIAYFTLPDCTVYFISADCLQFLSDDDFKPCVSLVSLFSSHASLAS